MAQSKNRATKRKAFQASGIEEDKMNKGGFYKGMPGVWLDKHGNRRIYEIRLTPEGEVESLMGAHPRHIRACISSLMSADPQTWAMMNTAVRRHRKENAHPFWRWVYHVGDWFRGIKINPRKGMKKSGGKKFKTEGMSPEEYQKEIDKLNQEGDEGNVVPLNSNQDGKEEK